MSPLPRPYAVSSDFARPGIPDRVHDQPGWFQDRFKPVLFPRDNPNAYNRSAPTGLYRLIDGLRRP